MSDEGLKRVVRKLKDSVHFVQTVGDTGKGVSWSYLEKGILLRELYFILDECIELEAEAKDEVA